MLDLKDILERFDEVSSRLKTRDASIDLSPLKGLASKRKELLQQVEALKQRRNEVSKEVGKIKKEGGDASSLTSEMGGVNANIKELDTELAATETELRDFLLTVPNVPHESVPEGADESANREERVVGERPVFEFEPKEHHVLGEALGIMDLSARQNWPERASLFLRERAPGSNERL